MDTLKNLCCNLLPSLSGNDPEAKNIKLMYLEDVHKYINLLLGSDDKCNIKLLQTCIIAVHDVQDKLYKVRNHKMQIDYNDDGALKLYNELVNGDMQSTDKVGFKLHKICTHRAVNTVKQVASTYISLKIPFTDTANQFVTDIVEKSRNTQCNLYNFVNNKNLMRDVCVKLDRLITELNKYEAIWQFKNKNENFNNDILITLKHMQHYFNLPIITQEDIEFFIKKLQEIKLDLRDDIDGCLKCQKIILNLPSGFVEDTKNSLTLDINRINMIGGYVNNLIILMRNALENKDSLNKSRNSVVVDNEYDFSFNFVLDNKMNNKCGSSSSLDKFLEEKPDK
jgi:hypothetical protein